MRWLFIIVATALMVLAFAPTASAKIDPSAPPVTVSLSPGWTHEWALKWESIAQRLRPSYARARACFGLSAPPSLPSRPHANTYDAWLAYGRTCKHLACRWAENRRDLRYRMSHPDGSGAERWRPLVRWHWPWWAQNRVIDIISHESGGSPTAVNRSSGATGLMQIYPGGDVFKNPDYNISYAYHKKFLCGGWSHWPSYGW